MRKLKWCRVWIAALACGVAVGNMSAMAAEKVEEAAVARWYVSGGLGALKFEGDEEVKDGIVGVVRLGYDWNDWWTLEGQMFVAPKLDENTVGETTLDANGNVHFERVSLLERSAGVHDTYAVGLALDGLFHFTRWERLDPYLALGGGVTIYGDEIDGERFDPSIRAGGGVMYHFNDEWAIRGDARTFLAGRDTQANLLVDGSVVWYWGARVPQKFIAVEGPLDSDGDGLSDAVELEIGTDPYDPDTDKDGLTDGEEVNTYKTDPLNPDSDWDGLKDGDEVHKHSTDPLKRDTDDGGVADGHEVIEDGTNPLDPSDDLLLFELNIQFDYDKAVLKAEYFPQLDVIAKVLARNPEATARIEGHADRNRKSSKTHNMRLSKERAESVLEYLVKPGGIAKSRLEAHGYGFTRPKAPNDPEKGNPVNRRVEVYIRGAAKGDAAVAPAPAAAPTPAKVDMPEPDTK